MAARPRPKTTVRSSKVPGPGAERPAESARAARGAMLNVRAAREAFRVGVLGLRLGLVWARFGLRALVFSIRRNLVVSQFEISATIISFSQDYQVKIEYLLTEHERFQVASF